MKTNQNGKNPSPAHGSRPVKSRRILFIRLAVVAAFLAALLWFVAPPPEPKYNGMTLGRWLDRYLNDFDSEPQRNEAADAVRHIGSNAVPYLMRWLTTSDSKPRERVEIWVNKHSPIKFNFMSANANYDRALFGFMIFGPQAESAIPHLEGLLSHTNTAERAAYMLCLIGPGATPALLRGLTNPSPNSRKAIVDAITGWVIRGSSGIIDNEPTPLPVPLLLALLHDLDPAVRMLGLQYIEASVPRNGLQADTIVPLLIEQLKGADLDCTVRAADVLGTFGPEATNAVPALLEILKKHPEPFRLAKSPLSPLAGRLLDRDEKIGTAAANALKKIDPQALKKAD